MNEPIRPFQRATITKMAAILGDTQIGLSNSEIEAVLNAAGLKDPRKLAEQSQPSVVAGDAYIAMNKRDRIAEAVAGHQSKFGNGKALVAFIREAMRPIRYLERDDQFEARRQALDQALSFEGFGVGDGGKVYRRRQTARTLTEAERLAGKLTNELQRRNTHREVLKYCTAEVLQKNNFHAALEACKGLAQRVRDMTNRTDDGHELFTAAFACKRATPLLKLNSLSTDTEKGEQTGFMNLLIGLFGMYRNPTSHDPRLIRQETRPISEQELLDLFTTISLAHKKLDSAA